AAAPAGAALGEGLARRKATAKDDASEREEAGRALSADLLRRTGAAAGAEGAARGELFEYRIDQPVSLPRQQSAMIPVAAQAIGGEKLSIYNPDVDARYPLNAVRLKNSTGLHLLGGPVAVFDGGIYAGDARMESVQPNAERTDRLLRFRVTVPPGHSAPLKVVMERTVEEILALVDADVNLLLTHARQTHASPALAAALRQVVERRGRIADFQRQRAQYEAEIQAMDQEQTRIRQNMQRLDRQCAPHYRYLATLNDQAARIEKL